MVPLPVMPSRDLINEFWERCARDEGRIDASTPQNLQEEFQDALAFGPLVVGPDNVSASVQVLADNYRKLVTMLRNAGSVERKLQLLAMWLQQEGILTPREFLPRAFRKKCVKDVLDALGMQHHDRVRRGSRTGVVKPAELRYALVAEAWKPYFELIHIAYGSLSSEQRRNPPSELRKVGFNLDAVNAIHGSNTNLRTSLEGACRFAAQRLRVGDDTVRVAHSKVYPTKSLPS